ncbi:MAG: hypothetical protein QHJ81_01925 [Anaerolineae bacterium]|nr:hypothetical protein [Anaerolineae bacterium]
MARTATDVTAEEMATYRATARLRWERKERESALRRERAWRVAHRAARLLKEQFSDSSRSRILFAGSNAATRATGKKLLHNLIDSLSLKSRRLYELRKKQAMMGLNTPPEVLIEIKELEEEIHELEEEFQIAGERIEALKEVTADAKAVP